MREKVAISAAQIRAARSLLGWNGAQLAEASQVSVATIRRMESAAGPDRSSAANISAVRRALEEAGIIFQDEDHAAGVGVRLRK